MNETASGSDEAAKIALHYGTMRFSMFTVFSAVIGATFAFAFSDGGRALFGMTGGSVLKHAYAAGCLALCVLFTLAELRITYLVSYYQEQAFDIAGSGFKRPRWHPFWSYLIALTMITPYLFAGVAWYAVLTDGILLPPVAGSTK